MSMTPTGKGRCDRCKQLEESTGIHLFLIVNDLDENSMVEVRHYCRRNDCADIVKAAGNPPAEKASKA